jgi:hypothetical protein
MKWLQSILARWGGAYVQEPQAHSPTPDQIRKAIERQCRKADETGLTQAFVGLAKDVFSYPSWITHSREGVPSLISQAHEVKPDHVQLIIANGRTLELTQKKLYGCSDRDTSACC